ncbi:nitroreductase family deazaflavin-dependent oxidoreductase [Streptomyces sp. PT12]|uniref:nitroreductase family deazaflavin-dependent oxidoreductase n=1 Tax=Streptomyces sp. PT12 TaxID=1510197 RepID=UPI00215D38F4|nr:nitroreductase family deazaflavin-dependent oxidoreductase [Streptomyces sp. PT12]
MIRQFRENGGRVGPPFEGAPLILITTVGARSGRPRTVPTLSFRLDDGNLLIIGSNGGADTDPAWYHNLIKDPRMTVETGQETYAALGRLVPTGSRERDRLFARAAAEVEAFADYQSMTRRTLPVVIVERRPG